MLTTDLTYIKNVLDWAQIAQGAPSQTQGPLIQTQISRCSNLLLAALGRGPLYMNTATENYDGKDNKGIMLRRWPVTAVSSLIVNNQPIPPGPPNQAGSPITTGGNPWNAGYYFDTYDGFPPGRGQVIQIANGRFPRGVSNVTITYTAGYFVANEAQDIGGSSAPEIIPLMPLGYFLRDEGVTYANGTPLIPVASNPAQGQYTAPTSSQLDSGEPVYQFNTADEGAPVLLTYSFIPTALENACCEWVCERLGYRTRIGQRSKSAQGAETTSYIVKGVPDYVAEAAEPFARVATFFG